MTIEYNGPPRMSDSKTPQPGLVKEHRAISAGTPVHHAPAYRPNRAMRVALGLAEKIAVGHLTVVLPNGEARHFQGAQPGPEAHLSVRNERMARRFLMRGHLGFCEAYLDGDWDSPDIRALFELFLLNQEALRQVMLGKPLIRWLSWFAHVLRPNSRTGSRRNIAAHYDLGNAFYAEWLDRSMTYSSALYTPAPEVSANDDALEAAQLRKYAGLCERLDLQPGHHVLEIGCGWGGFAEYAAGTVGARVTAITISQEQYEYARARIERAGLSDRVDIRLQDYRDVTGSFDRIASIEMFEAVGERYWPTFFDTVRARLAKGGRAALQIITIDDSHFPSYRRGGDYIQRYIFPGGMLPSPSVLKAHVERAGLTWQDAFSFGPDYARTLDAWNDRFQAAWPRIAPMGFDARFKRMWEQYLAYCSAGFSAGTIDVIHLAVARD